MHAQRRGRQAGDNRMAVGKQSAVSTISKC